MDMHGVSGWDKSNICVRIYELVNERQNDIWSVLCRSEFIEVKIRTRSLIAVLGKKIALFGLFCQKCPIFFALTHFALVKVS